jgi:hypothetical protein
MSADVKTLVGIPNGRGTVIDLFAGTWGGGVFISTNNGSSWTSESTGLMTADVRGFASTHSASGATNLFAGTYGGGVLLSTDNGISWTTASTGLEYAYVNALTAYPNGSGGMNLFAGTDGAGVFLSTDNGNNWNAVKTGLVATKVTAFATSPNGTGRRLDSSSGMNLFAGVAGCPFFAGDTNCGVFLSTDDGSSWTAISRGLTLYDVLALATTINSAGGTALFVGSISGAVFLSTNYGNSWTRTYLPSYAYARALATSPNRAGTTNVFAGTDASGIRDGSPFPGVFLSADYGRRWTRIGIQNTYSFATHPDDTTGTTLFAGTQDGVFLYTESDTGWAEISTGSIHSTVHALTVIGKNLLAGTNDGVFRRPLSDMVTAVEEKHEQNPSHFALHQNYPNPFNSLTRISFTVPSNGFASLEVFDLLGRKVTTIVCEELDPGDHTRYWNAAGLPSGVYFYRLSVVPTTRRDLFRKDGLSGPFTETKRLLYLK